MRLPQIFECLRKLVLVSILVFWGRSEVVQLTLGLLTCVLCIILYNNLKPYAVWQNDLLQQICQANVFVTLVRSLTLPTGALARTVCTLVTVHVTVLARVHGCSARWDHCSGQQ